MADAVSLKPKKPTITIKDMPTGAVSAQVYRVERKEGDKSIITQGVMLPMTYNYDDFIPANAEPFVISGTTLVACNKYTAFIAIPNGVKTIAKGAFSNKRILKELSLPVSLQYIEKEAFLK